MRTFIITLSLTGLASAVFNDWSTPCHSGACAWDMPAPNTNGLSPGALKLWADNANAIVDITPAAGWLIMNCTSDLSEQSFRMACANATACQHLTNAGSPVGRVVRLPDNCGSSPFGRIASMSPSQDQSLPTYLAYRQTLSQVYDMSIDANFHNASSSFGNVSFSLVATGNLPASGVSATVGVPERRHHRRGFHASRDAGYRRNIAKNNMAGFFGDFNKSKQFTLDPVSVNQHGNIFNLSVQDCKIDGVPFDAAVSVDVNAVANAQIKLGFVFAGSLIPPSLTEGSITADVSGSINSSLHIKATGDGSISSPSVQLLSIPIEPAALSIPKILNLGLTFQVVGRVNAALSAGVDSTVGVVYNIDSTHLVFPDSGGQSSASPSPQSTPLQMSASTNVSGTASVTAHLIPQIVLGVQIFSTKADVTLGLDAATTLYFDGSASTANASTGTNSTAAGCVDVSSTLAIQAGADADFFSLWSAGKTIDLYQKSFDIYSTCTNAQPVPVPSAGSIASNALYCPGSPLGMIPLDNIPAFATPS